MVGPLLLVLVAVIVWLAVTASRRRPAPEDRTVDRATSVSRMIVAVLALVALMITITGATGLLRATVESIRDDAYVADSADLARDIAFAVIGAPVAAVLLRSMVRRLHTPTERRAPSWALYLDAALLATLAGSMASGHALARAVLGDRRLRAEDMAVFAVWATVWALHWFALRARYAPPGGFVLAAGSAAGLVMTAVGTGGLLTRAAGLVYRPLADDVDPVGNAMSARAGLATVVVGGAVWSWHWLAHYRHDERTALWHVFVIVVGGLGGLATAIVGASITGYHSLVWFFGDSPKPDWQHHFTFVPSTAAVAVVGAASWWYHATVLGRRRRAVRTEPVRLSDYLGAGAGLVASVVGLVHVVMATIESTTSPSVGDRPDSANRWIAAVSLLAVGLPVWLVFWARVQRLVARGDAGERRAPVRRVYLVALLGASGAAALVGVIVTLTSLLRDLLDGTFGAETLRGMRVGLGLLVAVTGVVWYHVRVSWRERRDDALRPAERHRRVVLVTSDGADLARQLADTCGAHVVRWHRTDDVADVPIDVDRLASAITDSPSDQLLVVVGPGEAQIVPFDGHVPQRR